MLRVSFDSRGGGCSINSYDVLVDGIVGFASFSFEYDRMASYCERILKVFGSLLGLLLYRTRERGKPKRES